MSRYISRLGLKQAKRLFLTAEKIEAEEMLRIGFLTELVDADRLLARVDELSGVLAGMAPIALLGIKKHLNLIARAQVDMDDLEQEVRPSESSHDIAEGVLAWEEQRSAVLTGPCKRQGRVQGKRVSARRGRGGRRGNKKTKK